MIDKIRNAGKAKVIGVIAILLALAIAIGYARTDTSRCGRRKYRG